jgi:hypothetical protein
MPVLEHRMWIMLYWFSQEALVAEKEVIFMDTVSGGFE